MLLSDHSRDDRAVQRRPLVVARVRRALRREEIRLHYQPIVAIGRGEVVAAEALCRWQHPRRGLLAPGAFLPSIEASAALDGFNRFVIEAAIQQARGWREAGLELQVTVNVSPQSLTSDLVTVVDSSLTRWSLPPHLLHVEVTEHHDTAAARHAEALEELRALGTSVSLDDFGCGESSLARLASLRVDTLKIDRSFIGAMDSELRSARVVQSSIHLARTFELKAVAEGVETQAQWHRLRAWGCDFAQGFLISRPLPPAELMSWLEGDARPLLSRLGNASSPTVDRRVGIRDRRRGPWDRRNHATALG